MSASIGKRALSELGRKLKVVEKVLESHSEISLDEAKQKDPAEIGREIKEELLRLILEELQHKQLNKLFRSD